MNYSFSEAFAVPNKPVTDHWYGKLILRVYGDVLPFHVGDQVSIQSGLYNGTYEIGYIYKGYSSSKGNYWNLYFDDLKFEGNTSGTISTGTLTKIAAEKIIPIDQIADQELVTSKTADPIRTTAQVSYAAESQSGKATTAASITDTVQETATAVVEKANSLPARWFYFILFVIAIGVFIYYQSKN